MNQPTLIVGYLALFALVGIAFLLVNLSLGYLVRPREKNREKLEVYECGEPTIGSSYVQFDLRFYVVALLFIIFDVEVAFFFPWAVVFGKATHLLDPHVAAVSTEGAAGVSATQGALIQELGAAVPAGATAEQVHTAANTLAQFALLDIAAFFAILLMGFAYVWYRGDLDWVRALSHDRALEPAAGKNTEQQHALSA